jgi:hypothetical protein
MYNSDLLNSAIRRARFGRFVHAPGIPSKTGELPPRQSPDVNSQPQEDLKGALYHRWRSLVPDICTAMRLCDLRDESGLLPWREPQWMRVLMHVAIEFGFATWREIIDKRRSRDVVIARFVAMYIMHTDLHMSYPKTGARIGGRDHASVIHGVRRIKDMMQRDDEFRYRVERVQELVRGQIALDRSRATERVIAS